MRDSYQISYSPGRIDPSAPAHTMPSPAGSRLESKVSPSVTSRTPARAARPPPATAHAHRVKNKEYGTHRAALRGGSRRGRKGVSIPRGRARMSCSVVPTRRAEWSPFDGVRPRVCGGHTSRAHAGRRGARTFSSLSTSSVRRLPNVQPPKGQPQLQFLPATEFAARGECLVAAHKPRTHQERGSSRLLNAGVKGAR